MKKHFHFDFSDGPLEICQFSKPCQVSFRNWNTEESVTVTLHPAQFACLIEVMTSDEHCLEADFGEEDR